MSETTATMQAILDRLEAAERKLALYDAERAARRTSRPRRRTRGRLFTTFAVALLVALVPMGLLAAGPFLDLNTGPDHADANVNIQLIADAGITKGCDPPAYISYCPNDFVTREQMASFLARTAGLGTNPPVANAAKLGGQPASAYLKTGAIKATQVFSNQPGPNTGPAPRQLSASFSSTGGTLLIFAAGSGYRGAMGTIGMDIQVDSVTKGQMSAYTNEGASHKAFVANPLVVTGVAAGTHTLTLVAFTGTNATTIDATDYFSATVIELP